MPLIWVWRRSTVVSALWPRETGKKVGILNPPEQGKEAKWR